MEPILNSVWLLIAVAAFLATLPRARASRTSTLQPASTMWLAMACVLALLFPIISVSDDLHFDVQTLEEWTAGKRTHLTSAHNFDDHSSAGARKMPIALSAAVVLAFELALLALLQSAGVPAHVAFSVDRANPRSPPLLMA